MEQNNQIRFVTVEQDGFSLSTSQLPKVHLRDTNYYDIEVAEVLDNGCDRFDLVV